jgi:hypothetical protein
MSGVTGKLIGEAEGLITDAVDGLYRGRTPFRDELIRALRFAADFWGAETPWSDITEKDWIRLAHRRLDVLLAKGAKIKGRRAAEITFSRVITTVRWLREKKYIGRDDAPWPNKWKAEIVKYWEGKTGLVHDPELAATPGYTIEEAQRILNKSNFDPRFELLMWLGMGLSLGTVARAQRKDIEPPNVDWSAPDEVSLTLRGHYKKGSILLNAGQRAALARAFAEGGYLHDVEQRYRARALKNYVLFPSGYTAGRVGMLRGKETKLRLGVVDFTQPITNSWLRKNLRLAEERAGVKHIAGRSAFRLPLIGSPVPDTIGQRADVTSEPILDSADQRIIDVLSEVLPSAALSYEQAARDLASTHRLSWRGPATDLRESLRETLDHLAPDAEVIAQPGFRLEPDATAPTMKQKARFASRKRGLGSAASQTSEAAVDAVEATMGTFVRSVYTRSNVSTHTPTNRGEVVTVHRLVRTVLGDLLAVD